ncbi:hypothetical protein BaRGS_00024153 [Batillaria attramentaria]|uniref:Uncharacterized protein n=1 Tax=Batillaria attramentaria TaxID=370345 RepID=A0ABD0KCD7_9CAEN
MHAQGFLPSDTPVHCFHSVFGISCLKHRFAVLDRSGNDDEEKPSDFAKAVDDAIELAGGQEEPQKKKIKIDQATIDIREAAMDTENQRKVGKTYPKRLQQRI